MARDESEFPSTARTANGRDLDQHHREAVRRGLTTDTPSRPAVNRRMDALCRLLVHGGHMTPVATRQILLALTEEAGLVDQLTAIERAYAAGLAEGMKRNAQTPSS